MSDFFKKADRPPISRKRRWSQLLSFLLLVTLTALFVEHWRGERALRAWKRQVTAQGEIFDPTKIWPASNLANREFSNQLAQAVGKLPESLNKFAGLLAGLHLDGTGRADRGSKQASPTLSYEQNTSNTWQQLEVAIQQSKPALETIRKLMQNPPRAMDVNVATRLDLDAFPNLANIRRSSQALHTAVINDLHQGDLNAALENLEALQGSVSVYADEPALVNSMIRVAVLGLSNDACWDALQDERWTDSQLVRLQQVHHSGVLLAQVPKAVAAERIGRLHSLDRFASHNYQTWIDRLAPIHRSFGSKAPELDTANLNGAWRKWVFHPAWDYAWREQEELDYLHFSEQEMTIVREFVEREAWIITHEKLTALRKSYRRPPADWRFYRSIPLYDTLSEVIGGKRVELTECPYPDFSRAWFATAKNLTQHEMVIAVIALQRYQLREGKMPKALAALVPEYLKALPRDLMDGQPLRYRLNADGSFGLYSVGEDAQDGGGDARPSESNASQQKRDWWNGRDWVWPHASPRPKT